MRVINHEYIFSEFFVHHNADFNAACGGQDDLMELLQQIPDVLDSARAPSTSALYKNAFQKWSVWVRKYPTLVVMPATPETVMLYFMFLRQSAHSFSTINLASSAIAWGHCMSGFISPTKSALVSEFLNGLKVQLAKPRVPKEPFLVSHVHKFLEIMNKRSLTDCRDTCMIVLAFHGFFRFDELSKIKVGQVHFFPTHVDIMVEHAKNDQLREGNTVSIAKLSSAGCPVQMLAFYMKMSDNEKDANKYLFRRIIVQNSRKILFQKNVPVTYTSVRDMVKRKASQIGLDPTKFCTHSMRAGGSSAAANAGINDRIFQRHGRWASVSAKDGYIKDSLEQRLSVTLALA
jgi:integrase